MLGTVVVLASGSRVCAQGPAAPDEAARQHFQSGRLHYDDGEYEAALREFESAYERSHHPELLFNLYLTTERLGQLDASIQYLERFLAEGQPSDEQREQLTRRLENMRERRDRAAAEAAAATPVGPAPDAAIQAPAPTRSSGDLLPAAIAFGVAGAALISFGITGGLALAENASIRDGCAARGNCTEGDVSTLRTLNAVADASWITAAVGGVAGVILLVTLGLPSESPSESGQARLLPLLSPAMAGANLEVSF